MSIAILLGLPKDHGVAMSPVFEHKGQDSRGVLDKEHCSFLFPHTVQTRVQKRTWKLARSTSSSTRSCRSWPIVPCPVKLLEYNWHGTEHEMQKMRSFLKVCGSTTCCSNPCFLLFFNQLSSELMWFTSFAKAPGTFVDLYMSTWNWHYDLLTAQSHCRFQQMLAITDHSQTMVENGFAFDPKKTLQEIRKIRVPPPYIFPTVFPSNPFRSNGAISGVLLGRQLAAFCEFGHGTLGCGLRSLASSVAVHLLGSAWSAWTGHRWFPLGKSGGNRWFGWKGTHLSLQKAQAANYPSSGARDLCPAPGCWRVPGRTGTQSDVYWGLFKDSLQCLQTHEILGVVLDLFMFEVPGMERFLWWGQGIVNHWQGEPEFMDSQIVG